jgi:hypothetical protein
MKYSIFCLFVAPSERPVNCPPSLYGHHLDFIQQGALCAVCEQISSVEDSPCKASLFSHYKVVDFFFQQTTVVPFRYGIALDSKALVAKFLENRADHYTKILEELEDCAEMGIRAIIPSEGTSTMRQKVCKDTFDGHSLSGAQYLRKRQERYAAESCLSQQTQEVVERIRRPFLGLFRQARCEFSTIGHTGKIDRAAIASLYFLVPRDAIGEFRKTFERLSAKEPCKLLLSGAWPPYNFVSSPSTPLHSASRVLAKLI